ncbi:carbohydrate ABC transporter permease [Alicyclobacillus shizuokensis]|uniref:carbohydrate ABC transporter permease n=1 Tax=Alicyclobacillus shizuokensis TaxID=392014 RepID=UPI0008308C32|nr:carbohydrate ABC transporter permease [Alicyclobacillus shizuokensis]
MVNERTFAGRAFDAANIVLLTLVSLATLLPFVYVVVASFSATDDIIPKSFTLSAYRYLFSTDTFVRSLGISIYITVVGTVLSLVATALSAYALSHRKLPGRRFFLLLVLFTMLFNGGMIPTYFVVKDLGMINTLWSLMIPGLISSFYLIIMKNFFLEIPEDLKEAARIDGCTELGVLFRVVLPLSLPVLAAFGLLYAVGIWNQYFNAILYINDQTKWPIQVLLQQIVVLASGGFGNAAGSADAVQVFGQGVRMAVIVVSTIPILIVYPFLQKHFAKGMLIGSVKG